MNKFGIKFLFFGFLIIILSSSCISRPDYVLDEVKMVDVLTDVHLSEAMMETQQMNSDFESIENYRQAIMASVLVKNGVTRAQYDSSLVWYGQNLKYLVRVYNKVQKNLTTEVDYWDKLTENSKSEFALSEAGDSVNVWSVEKYLYLAEDRMNSFRFWEIPSDSNYYAGDSIIWQFDIPQIPDSHYLVASLSLYNSEDNSFIGKSVAIQNDTSFTISCNSDTAKLFTQINASLSLVKDSLSVKDDYVFIDNISLIRIHR